MNNPANPRFWIFVCVFFSVLIIPAQSLFAEGSKELNANGGSRAFLVSGTSVTPSFSFPTPGTMKVYAKLGEIINVGSSVQGIGFGTINLRAPNGNSYTSGTSATIGLIANRMQEVAGPLPGAGGYTPYTRTVLPGEEGVWEIDFIAQNSGVPGGENPVPVAASANWTQPTGQYISAFDVSVRNLANTAFLTGRVYTNIFSGILGTFDVGFNGIFKILTRDGYQYSLDNNGQAGNGFSFFVNNKGFRKADGNPSYQSINSLISPNIQDPRAADTQTDITYKIFFNDPATDLPAAANTPGGGTTWLLNSLSGAAISNAMVTGIEGTAFGGTYPLGINFNFTANKNGVGTVTIDVDKNGLFTDAADRKLSGNVLSGDNNFYWDGLDQLGNKVPAGNYNANVDVTLLGGEVHFPFFDVERNINGLKLTRNNGPLSPNFTVYWDDTPITNTGTPSNPVKNTTGLNSQINGHKWGTAGTSAIEFGDEKGLDTWTYIASTPLVVPLTLRLQEANLEVSAIAAVATGNCIGQTVTYTIPVKNNGPDAVSGSKFTFNFPAELTNVTVTSTQTTGVSTINNGTVGSTAYTALLDMANGAIRTFTVTGKVTGAPASGTVTVSASILRTADMTDPDATDPDAAKPTDANAECNAAPSGPGCNNIKSNTLTFTAPPNAGADADALQDDIVTLTATGGAGTWSQVGNLPAAAIIATPAAINTTISGLKTVGKYYFVRTNTVGCTDTVMINVVPKKIDIPTVFTPDGDGKNDAFTIPGIGSFPGSRLLIFNRWGNEVYRSEDYKNTWTGEGLSNGTYYYVFDKKELSGSYTTLKGWVFLKR